MIAVVFAVLIIVALIIGVIWLHNELVERDHQVQSLLQTKAALIQEKEDLTERLGHAVLRFEGLVEENSDLQQKYAALEMGADEQAENYEQQFLSFQEVLEKQAKAIAHLKDVAIKHETNCLPVLEEVRAKHE